jgi:hypothetical protein
MRFEKGSKLSSQTCSAGIACEKLQQRIFLGRERHAAARPGNALGRGIQNKIGDIDFRGAKLAGAPQQGTKPGKQFAEFEWLRQIVVRAMVQPCDAVLHSVARRQHQDRHALAGFSQLAANFETVAARNHHVEDHKIVGIDGRLIEGIVSRGGDIDGVGLFAQALGHEPRNARVVFD